MELYGKIVQDPRQIFEHGTKYLQMFKEVLESRYANKFTNYFPDVLNQIVHFYTNDASEDPN